MLHVVRGLSYRPQPPPDLRTSALAAVFAALDRAKKTARYGILSYGLDSTSLDDVFLRLQEFVDYGEVRRGY